MHKLSTCSERILFYIYSNKKETSDFHGTVSFDLVKIFTTKIKPKCLSNVGHTKIGNCLILSSYLEGLLNLMCTQLFPLSLGSYSSKRDTFYVKLQPGSSDDENTSKNPKSAN